MIRFAITVDERWQHDIEALRQRDGGTLGFVPIDTYRQAISRRRIIVATYMGFLVGFAWFTLPSRNTAKLKQLCVHEDWRRQGIGTELVACVIRHVGSELDDPAQITLRCRDDIEAGNAVWRKHSFEPISSDLNVGTRGHRVTTWRRAL